MDKRLWEFGGGNVPFPFGTSSQNVLNALRQIRHIVHTELASKLEDNWNTTRLDHVLDGRKTSQRHEREIESTPPIIISRFIPKPFCSDASHRVMLRLYCRMCQWPTFWSTSTAHSANTYRDAMDLDTEWMHHGTPKREHSTISKSTS